MIAKAANALGRSLMLGEIDIYARFAVLFAIAVASVIAFYTSVILTIGILAEEAGAVGVQARWPSFVALAIVGVGGLFPILRFVVADLPDLARQMLEQNLHRLLMGLALAVSCVVLLVV